MTAPLPLVIRLLILRGEGVDGMWIYADPFTAETAHWEHPVLPDDRIVQVGDALTMAEFQGIANAPLEQAVRLDLLAPLVLDYTVTESYDPATEELWFVRDGRNDPGRIVVRARVVLTPEQDAVPFAVQALIAARKGESATVARAPVLLRAIPIPSPRGGG